MITVSNTTKDHQDSAPKTDIEQILATLDDSTRLMRLPEVIRKVGISRTVIYGMMRDGEFPRPLQLGKNSVAWVNKDIDMWIADKILRSAAPRKN